MIETSVVETTEIATQDLNQLVDDWQQQLVDQTPQQILSFALKQFKEISLSFSGAEDVVLIHMASQITSGVKVFTLDTGRLHPETYQYIDLIRKTYPISLSVAFPEPEAVQQLVNEKGLFSFYQDGHQECCGRNQHMPARARRPLQVQQSARRHARRLEHQAEHFSATVRILGGEWRATVRP